MPRRYVNELGHQEAIDEVFVAGNKQLRPNRNGNLYLQLELSDRTGSISARVWNASETLYHRSTMAITSASPGPPSSTRARCR